MGEAELIGIIRDVDAQYAVLLGQLITINFAMILAIYYFLYRAPLRFRAAAFGLYVIGMLALIGMMLEQANYKFRALEALAGLPPGRRSDLGLSIVALHHSWLAEANSLMLNICVWVLFVAIAYLLFSWRGDPGADLGERR